MSRRSGTIVVGVDGSATSGRALAWAVEQALADHRPITLVHALPPTTPAWLDPSGDNPREAHELSVRAKGQDALDRAHDVVRRLAPDLPVFELFRLDDPRAVLVDVSETAAMIVLGSRGRGHLKSMLLGSTAVAVVPHAECPVVVHRPTGPAPERRGIAVGVDDTEASLPVLEFAFRQASQRDLPLTVVHSFWYFRHPELEEQVPLADSVAVLAEKYPEVAVHTEIDQGSPERFLLHLANRMNLLVVGARHGNRPEHSISGSMAVCLVEHGTCPVAVVPL